MFKNKSLLIYGSLVIIVALLLLISSLSGNEEAAENISGMESEMPQDDIHSQFNMKDHASQGKVKAEIMRKMADLKTAVEKNPSDTLKMREYADFLSMSHKTDEALNYYNKILAVDEKRVDILLAIGLIHFNSSNLKAAEETTLKILSINENHEEANYNLGAIAAKNGQNEKARKIWEDLVKRFPNSQVAKFAAEGLKKL